MRASEETESYRTNRPPHAMTQESGRRACLNRSERAIGTPHRRGAEFDGSAASCGHGRNVLPAWTSAPMGCSRRGACLGQFVRSLGLARHGAWSSEAPPTVPRFPSRRRPLLV